MEPNFETGVYTHIGSSLETETGVYVAFHCQMDIHLHCDEWDRLLNEGDWEPEQIVSKLPKFLNFVSKVQNNVKPARDEH